jgi:hypothetical protein
MLDAGTSCDRAILVGVTLGLVYVGYLFLNTESQTKLKKHAAPEKGKNERESAKDAAKTDAGSQPAEESDAKAKRVYTPAKQWLQIYSKCYKITPGSEAKLSDPTKLATKMYVADIKQDAAIISVKGWGGGMKKEDFVAHLGVCPSGKDGGSPTPTAEFVEASAKQFQQIAENGLFESLAGLQKIFVQWEADEIWDESDGFSTFAVYLYGVASALQTKFGKRFCGFISQKLDNKKDKLTTQALLPLDKAEKIRSQKGVQALANFFNLPIYLEVHPSFGDPKIHGGDPDTAMVAGAADIAFMQKHTSFGFWGHAAHSQFSNVKAIIAYGGGGTLPAEELQGYSAKTTIVGMHVTRKAGKEKSTFAEKHMGGGR